jgi:exosortase A
MIKQDKKLWVSFAFLLGLWGFTFYPAILSMEDIWRRSDTFAHGYFILPIVAWLIWRDRAYFLNSNTKVSWLALPFFIAGLASYLFAYAADINVLSQLAAVITLISIIWFLIGNHLAWHYKFPLAYLFFLVPMGENLIPDLQDITAWFTVFFLKLNGIPVFRDGLYIQTPSGLFEVAVACSGIRYLIASVAVGTLYAYLSYRSIKKKLIFSLFAFILPVIANGIRAYLIVAIAHYSNMKYATGADHLVYGWLFFGFVIMLMFWIGGRFADPELSEAQLIESSKANQVIQQGSIIGVSIVVSLLISTQIFYKNIPIVVAPVQPSIAISELPEVSKSNWGVTFNNGVERSHVIDENNVEVFIAKFANKQTSGEMISWGNVFHNSDYWTVVDSKVIETEEGSAKIVHLRNTIGTSRSYIYHYVVSGSTEISANKIKLLQAWGSLMGEASLSEVYAISIFNNADLASVEKTLSKWFVEYKRLSD